LVEFILFLRGKWFNSWDLCDLDTLKPLHCPLSLVPRWFFAEWKVWPCKTKAP